MGSSHDVIYSLPAERRSDGEPHLPAGRRRSRRASTVNTTLSRGKALPAVTEPSRAGKHSSNAVPKKLESQSHRSRPVPPHLQVPRSLVQLEQLLLKNETKQTKNR